MSQPETVHTAAPAASVVIVSFNTRDLLAECLETLAAGAGDLDYEVIVVDNASRDGSADLVALRFPAVRLLRSDKNLGFAAANNLGFTIARGRYLVLLNSDAFPAPGAIARAVRYMDEDPGIGLGGARLIGRDGAWQPSARQFPSLLNDFLTLSGLAARWPRSRFFGRFDRTWADPLVAADVDWVPGAFSIMPRALVGRIGAFDEAFFLYYEEVDLCRRVRAAGLRVRYWPDVEVVHIGGESSRTITHLDMSGAGKGSQLTLWRMRSALLYYRKHHGWLGAWSARALEALWHRARAWRNRGDDPARAAKRADSLGTVALLARAWADTDGGRHSPPRPW